MNSAADALAIIRAKLADLEARAAARRERDAEREVEPAQQSTARAPHDRVDSGAGWKAAQGRNWLVEAREDLARVDAAVTMSGQSSKRRIRPVTAPEYASEASAAATLWRESAANRTEPTTVVGGNADGAAAGNPEELRDGQAHPAAVPAASEARTGEGAKCPLPASGAATHGVRKQPQARAEHWTVRRDRIDDRILRASLVPSMPFAGPWDDVAPVQPEPKPAARSGRGPPGW